MEKEKSGKELLDEIIAEKKVLYILVGSYKTNPAGGWYINDFNYCILWRKISKRFGVDVTFNNSYPDSDVAPPITFGRISGIDNFFFYDLKPYDSKAGTSSDKVLFAKCCLDFCDGLVKLMDFIKNNPGIKIRLGVQSLFVAGLFIYYFQNKGCLGLCQKGFSHFNSCLGKNKPGVPRPPVIDLGAHIKSNFGMSLPANLEIVKIYNLTQPCRNFADLPDFHNSWNDFLK